MHVGCAEPARKRRGSITHMSATRLFTLRRLLPLALLIGLALSGGYPPASAAADAQEERSRFCQGFLYCKETKGDRTSTQAFLYLYSTEDRGTYSRLTVIPFYSREMDPSTNYLRRSVLWPLGISELKGDASYFQILPFYWHADDPSRQYTVLFPFYFDYAGDGRRFTHLIPLYGHHQRDDYFDRYFLLGPFAMATFDTRTDRKEWDVLFPLFHHEADLNGSSTRLIPLYFSGENLQDGSWYRHVLPVYGRSVTSQTDWHYLFPLYGSFSDDAAQVTRTSAIGFPPIPRVNFPSLALYEHTSTAASVSDRLFPLYRYAHAINDNMSQLDIMLFFQSRSGPTLTAHRLFPLYYYENDRAQDHTEWSVLGYDQISLAGYGHKPAGTWHQFIPLYRATEDLKAQTHNVNVLGIGPLSFFRYWGSPAGAGHRFFPIYAYDHPAADEWHWSALFPGPISLYRHDRDREVVHDRFTPFYDWADDGKQRELSMFGVSSFSLFRQVRHPAAFTQRFFPLYGYSSSTPDQYQLSLLGLPPREQTFAWSLYEQAGSSTYVLTRLFPLYRFERNDETKEVNWSALLVYQHKETETYLLDAFLPLHEYERNGRKGTAEWNLVGLKPFTLFQHRTGPDARNSFLLPLYDYDRQGDDSRLSLIGLPKLGTLPTLSLFEKVETPSLMAHRFFPLYRYRRDDEAKTRDWDALLLLWHRETEQRLRDLFLPLVDIEHDRQSDLREVGVLGIRPLTFFKYRSSPKELSHYAALLYHYSADGDTQRFSAFGLPRFGDIPALSLFARERTPSLTMHRFFPLYHYSYDRTQNATTWNALWLYWHHSDPAQTRNTFFPLGSVRLNSDEQEWDVSVLGVEPVSLMQIGKSPTSARNRFSPLWDYHADGNDWGLSFVGVRRLAFFSHEQTADSTTDHLFPLWWHADSPSGSSNVIVPLWSASEDHRTNEQTTGVLGAGPLSLYYQKRSPSGVSARIFPAWSYQYEEATQEGRTGVLGIPPLSLYYRRTSPAATENRLFPLFRSTNDLIRDESEFWFLWPLFDHKTAQGRTTETSSLWWLFEYRSPKADEWEYWVLGHPPIAMFMRTVSPTKTLVEINPVIPGWRREYVEGVGTSWALFGGLIGMDATPDGAHKLRLLWVLRL